MLHSNNQNFSSKIAQYLKVSPFPIEQADAKEYYISMVQLAERKDKYSIAHCCNSIGRGDNFEENHAKCESLKWFQSVKGKKKTVVSFDEWFAKVLNKQEKWLGNYDKDIMSYSYNKKICTFFTFHQQSQKDRGLCKRPPLGEEAEDAKFVGKAVTEISKYLKLDDDAKLERIKNLEDEVQSFKNLLVILFNKLRMKEQLKSVYS